MRKSYRWTRGDRGHWRLCLSSFSRVLGVDAYLGPTRVFSRQKGHQQPTETNLWEAGLLKRSKERWTWWSRDTSPMGTRGRKTGVPENLTEEGWGATRKVSSGATFENKGKGYGLKMRGRGPVLFRTPRQGSHQKTCHVYRDSVCLTLWGHSEDLLTGRPMVLAAVSWQKQEKSGACFPKEVLLSSSRGKPSLQWWGWCSERP